MYIYVISCSYFSFETKGSNQVSPDMVIGLLGHLRRILNLTFLSPHEEDLFPQFPCICQTKLKNMQTKLHNRSLMVVNIIWSLYSNNLYRIIHEIDHPEPFKCASASDKAVFSMIVDYVMREILDIHREIQCYLAKFLRNFNYADNITLLSNAYTKTQQKTKKPKRKGQT